MLEFFRQRSHTNILQLQLRPIPTMAAGSQHQSRFAQRTKFSYDKNGPPTGHHGLAVVLHDATAAKTGHA